MSAAREIPTPNYKPAAAFTLIELLVAVAIIALLIAILLPSLSRARSTARGTACASNMHQFGVSMLTYSGMNANTLAFYNSGSEVYNGVTVPGGYFWYAKALSTSTGQLWFYGQGLWHDAGLNAAGVASCPSLNEYGLPGSILGFNGYGYNGAIGGGINMSTMTGAVSDTVAIADQALINFKATYISSTFINPPRDLTTGNFNSAMFQGRHLGRGSVLWLDGHATLEKAMPVPATVTLAAPSSEYINRSLGYLVRSPDDLLDKTRADYYFTLK